MIMQKTFLFIFFFLISIFFFSEINAQETGNKTPESAAKINKLMDGTDYNFIRKTDIVWYAGMSRKSLKDFRLIVTVDEDLLVAFVTIIPNNQFEETPELTEALLSFNNSLDFVKAGLDKDRDIFVRIDSSVRTMDEQSFKEMIEQLAACADKVYEGMEPFLISGSGAESK